MNELPDRACRAFDVNAAFGSRVLMFAPEWRDLKRLREPMLYMRRSVIRVISEGTPSLSAKPGHSPVPLLT